MAKGLTPEQAIEKSNAEAIAVDAKMAADAKAAKAKAEADAKAAAEGTTPKVDETTPKVDETTPKVDETTPKVDETTPKPDETVPKVDDTTPKPVLVPKEEVERRIGRMYARLQEEKAKHVKPPETDENGEPKPLTTAEAEAIWDRKENTKKFTESETKVLLRHPTALNADGSFNMDDPFTQAYIAVGRNNQSLCFMVNGPELAEAMVEKQLGIQFKEGIKEGTKSVAQTNNAHTGASTIAVNASTITTLSDFKQKIARRMNMTDVEYQTYEAKIKKGDRRVG